MTSDREPDEYTDYPSALVDRGWGDTIHYFRMRDYQTTDHSYFGFVRKYRDEWRWLLRRRRRMMELSWTPERIARGSCGTRGEAETACDTAFEHEADTRAMFRRKP